MLGTLTVGDVSPFFLEKRGCARLCMSQIRDVNIRQNVLTGPYIHEVSAEEFEWWLVVQDLVMHVTK